MRVIGEVSHNHFKITFFHWNGKYIIKIESGMIEQIYKVDEFEVTEAQLPALLSDTFMKAVEKRFHEMHMQLHQAVDDL